MKRHSHSSGSRPRPPAPRSASLQPPAFAGLQLRLSALVLLSSLAGLGAACGGGAGDLVVVSGKPFSQETLNDESNAIGQKKVLERLAKQPPPAGTDAVVAVTGTAELTGLDLSTGKTWSYKHPLDHRPSIAGPYVIGQGGGEIFAVDARTGAERWKNNKAKGKLIGAGSDGKNTALTIKTSEGSTLLIIGENGAVKADKTTEQVLTVPGVASGLVFVPWKNLYVTAFEADTGNQLATFVTDTETTHVLAYGGALFAGQGRLVRFDENLLKAKQGGSALAIPPKDMPNVSRRDLLVGPEHDDRLQADAIDSTALSARPTPSGPAGFVGDRIYGAYYPLVMGWQSKDAKLAWVHTSKDDIIAVHAAKDGVVVVDKAGNVKLIAGSNGALVKTMSLGKPAMSADAFADTISIGGGGESKPLPQLIRDAVTLKDDRLATAQVYLLEQAASVSDEATTEVLLEVADSDRAAPTIKDAARKAIAMRTNGAAAMIKLLARRANFLKDTRTPPVGPMAKALAAMKEKSAAGPLLAQLLDPALPQIDLLDTAEGVGALAEKEHLPQLQRFISMYRGSSTGNMKLTDAIGAIAAAIIRIDGDKGKEWLTTTAKDALTDADVRTTLMKAVEAATPKKKDEPKDEPKPDDKDKDKKKKKKTDEGPEPPGYKKKKEAEKKAEEEKKAKEEEKKKKKESSPSPAPSTSP